MKKHWFRKHISLALAGIMAVSLCAGCSETKAETKAESTTAVADVNIEEAKTFKVKPSVEFVSSADKDIKMTLSLEDGSFSKDVSKDSIKLSGSFEKMKVENVSAGGKDLTLQITGDIEKNKTANAYLSGIVSLDQNAITDSAVTTRVAIDVRDQGAYLIAKDIQVSGDTVTIPLNVVGIADTGKLTKNDISFDKNAKVTEAKKISDTHVELTLNVAGAKDKNTAAKLLDGTKVTVGDHSFMANTSGAGFYTVFDYVEDDGDNLKMTLKMYSQNGTFADSFKESDISFGSGFKDAKVTSFKKISDSDAEIIISFPAKGQTSEKVSVSGNIILAAGALVNNWGDKTGEAFDYVRDYSNESLGRGGVGSDISTVKKFVDVFSKKQLGTFGEFMTTAGVPLGFVKAILEVTGATKSSDQKMKERLDVIAEGMDTVLNVLDNHTKLLQSIRKSQYADRLASFDQKVARLMTLNEIVEQKIAIATETLGVEIPDPDESDDSKWNEFNAKLVDAIIEAEKGGATEFVDFSQKIAEQESLFSEVANTLITGGKGSTNPIVSYDEFCTQVFNFNTTPLEEREAYRFNIKYQLQRALACLMLSKNYVNNQNNSNVCVAMKLYTNALNLIDEMPVEEPNEIYCYTWNRTMEALDPYWTGDMFTINEGVTVTEDQVNDFIKRMNGRTLKEELEKSELAIPENSSIPIEGVYFGMQKPGYSDFQMQRVLKEKYVMSSYNLTGEYLNKDSVFSKIFKTAKIYVMYLDDNKLSTWDALPNDGTFIYEKKHDGHNMDIVKKELGNNPKNDDWIKGNVGLCSFQ